MYVCATGNSAPHRAIAPSHHRTFNPLSLYNYDQRSNLCYTPFAGARVGRVRHEKNDQAASIRRPQPRVADVGQARVDARRARGHVSVSSEALNQCGAAQIGARRGAEVERVRAGKERKQPRFSL